MSENLPETPANRITRVVAQNVDKAEEASRQVVANLENKDNLERQAEQNLQKAEESSGKISEINQEQDNMGTFGKIGEFITKKKENEMTEEIGRKGSFESAATKAKTKAEETGKFVDAAIHAKTRAETVADANRRNIDASGNPVPIETSTSMKEALANQSEIAQTIVFYAEHNYPETKVEYLIPSDFVDKFVTIGMEASTAPKVRHAEWEIEKAKAEIEDLNKNGNPKEDNPYWLGKERYIHDANQKIENTKNSIPVIEAQGKKETVDAVVQMTPLWESMIKITEEQGLEINQHLLLKAFKIGTLRNNTGIIEYYKEVMGRDPQLGMGDYYYGPEMNSIQGYADLGKFFKDRPNIKGKNKTPYVYAYAMGNMVREGGLKINIAEGLSRWIAGTVEVNKVDMVFKKGIGWVESNGRQEELGFDYFLLRSSKESGLSGDVLIDSKPAEVLADEKVLSILENMRTWAHNSGVTKFTATDIYSVNSMVDALRNKIQRTNYEIKHPEGK